jgi:hypothetical protein
MSIRDSEFTLKVFLPRRYSETITDDDLEAANSKTVLLYLVYRGVCVKSVGYELGIQQESEKPG